MRGYAWVLLARFYRSSFKIAKPAKLFFGNLMLRWEILHHVPKFYIMLWNCISDYEILYRIMNFCSIKDFQQIAPDKNHCPSLSAATVFLETPGKQAPTDVLGDTLYELVFYLFHLIDMWLAKLDTKKRFIIMVYSYRHNHYMKKLSGELVR